MNELENFFKTLSILDLVKFVVVLNQLYHRRLDGFDYIEDVPEDWKKMLDSHDEEMVICSISNVLDDDTIIKYGFDEMLSHASSINMTEIRLSDYPYNPDSIIMKQYPLEEEIKVYLDAETDKSKIKLFYDSYMYDEKFNENIDMELAKIHYSLIRTDAFVYAETKEVDNYERKHHEIRKFFKVWQIYKSLDNVDKPRFLEKIIKEHHIRLNWRTVSRLFDMDDNEFIDTFNDYIDWEFAKQYHPKLKNKND